MIRKTCWYTVSTLALLACSILACAGEPGERVPGEVTETEKAGGTAVVCSAAQLESLNTFVTPDLGAADVRLLLFTPLVLYGEGGSYRPYLATSWDWENGQRRLVFEIRRDLTWHDGEAVTVEDVAWTVEIAADPEYGYPSTDDYSTLEDVVVRDSTAVELRFSEPMVGGLEQFVWLPVLPRHLLGEVPAAEFARAEYHRSPVGSGPYKFAGRRPDGSLAFDRHDGFPEDLGRPYLDRVLIRAILEPSAILVELETGGVDLCVTGSSVAERAQGSERLSVVRLEPPQSVVVPLNARHSPLDDARVRRALSAGLRRCEMAIASSPVARPARNPLPESSPWFDPEFVQPDDDSTLAVSLLESAGWSGSDGIRRNPQGQELRFTLLAPQGWETTLTIAQAQWRRIGVQVDLRFMEWSSYVGVLQDPDRRPDAMALSFYPEKIFVPDSELFSEFHSTGFSNLGSYSNAAVDSLLERLRAPIAPDERREIYQEIQRRVAEDVPMLFTIYVPRVAIVGPRLRGVTADLNGPFSSVTRWWVPPQLRR